MAAAGAPLLARPLFARVPPPAAGGTQAARLAEIEAVVNRGPFKPTWESLEGFKVPEWYVDGKFGIFIHWGVYSVPAFGNEWYPRNMCKADTDEFKHHVATYGSQARFGYKDCFGKAHGPLRSVVERVLRAFLTCGLVEHGFARLWCGTCRTSVLVPFSCRPLLLPVMRKEEAAPVGRVAAGEAAGSGASPSRSAHDAAPVAGRCSGGGGSFWGSCPKREPRPWPRRPEHAWVRMSAPASSSPSPAPGTFSNGTPTFTS